MAKTRRSIIKIDEEKCDGCGLCIPSCPEGALQIVDGKARLVKESFCDGLGACLGDCPRGALRVVEEEVEEYDEGGVITHIKENSPELLDKHLKHLEEHADKLPMSHSHAGQGGCPSAKAMQWHATGKKAVESPQSYSELRQWPVQLHLVPPDAPFFQNSDLVLVADCVPFAYSNFHSDFLRDGAIAVGCPKLDDQDAYVSKVTSILEKSDIRSLKVVHMEVPCCFGLVRIAQESLRRSKKDIPFDVVMIGIRGEILLEKKMQ